jgi:glycosyltransferase involved in cell wall biosynthesis
MKVLHLISSSGFFGAEKVLVELVLATEKTGSGVTPYAGIINNSYDPHTEIVDILVKTSVPCPVFQCGSRFDIKLIFALRSFIVKNDIEVVHAHEYKSNFYALVATLFLKTRRVATVHNWIRTDAKLKVFAVVDKLLLRGFDAVAVVSRALYDEVRAARLPARKIHVINNGVSIDEAVTGAHAASAKKELGINAASKIIGTVGRMSEEKGHLHFVMAALAVLKEYRDTRFLLVGEGPLKGPLAALVKEKGYADNFIFAGARTDVPVCLKIMDIFVLPSLQEGMPMALLEAMAAAKPVIATRVGAVPSVIIDTVNGLLVEPGDEAGLAKSISRLLKNEPEARGMAAKAFVKVKSEYSADAMAREYIKLYNGIYQGV